MSLLEAQQRIIENSKAIISDKLQKEYVEYSTLIEIINTVFSLYEINDCYATQITEKEFVENSKTGNGSYIRIDHNDYVIKAYSNFSDQNFYNYSQRRMFRFCIGDFVYHDCYINISSTDYKNNNDFITGLSSIIHKADKYINDLKTIDLTKESSHQIKTILEKQKNINAFLNKDFCDISLTEKIYNEKVESLTQIANKKLEEERLRKEQYSAEEKWTKETMELITKIAKEFYQPITYYEHSFFAIDKFNELEFPAENIDDMKYLITETVNALEKNKNENNELTLIYLKNGEYLHKAIINPPIYMSVEFKTKYEDSQYNKSNNIVINNRRFFYKQSYTDTRDLTNIILGQVKEFPNVSTQG